MPRWTAVTPTAPVACRSPTGRTSSSACRIPCVFNPGARAIGGSNFARRVRSLVGPSQGRGVAGIPTLTHGVTSWLQPRPIEDRVVAPQGRNHGPTTELAGRAPHPDATKAWRPRGTKPRRSATSGRGRCRGGIATATISCLPTTMRRRRRRPVRRGHRAPVASVKTLKCARYSWGRGDRKELAVLEVTVSPARGGAQTAADHSSGSARCRDCLQAYVAVGDRLDRDRIAPTAPAVSV